MTVWQPWQPQRTEPEENPYLRLKSEGVATEIKSPLTAQYPHLFAIPSTARGVVETALPFGKYIGEKGREELRGEFMPPTSTTDPVKLKAIEERLRGKRPDISPYESLAGETLSAMDWLAFPAAMRTAGTVAKGILPKGVTKAFTTPLSKFVTENKWYQALISEEQRLVNQSLEELMKRGYSEAEIIRKWKNPEHFRAAVERRMATESPLPFIKGEGTVPSTKPTAISPIPQLPPRPATEPVPTPLPLGVRPPAVEPPLSQRGIIKNFDEFMEKLGYRLASEEKGQAILDEMIERNISPQDVNSRFWSVTYPKLNEQQKNFIHKYIGSMSGLKPGSVLSVDASGNKEIVRDWQHLGKELDLGSKAEFLEGTERGYVSIIQAANERLAGPIVESPPTVKRAELFGLKEGVPELEPTRKALEPIKEMRKVYRAFDSPEDALGKDVSFATKPFGYGGAYEMEITGPKVQTSLGEAHPGEYRGSIVDPNQVTKIYYEPEYWDKPFMEQTLAKDLPKLKEMFPNAKFQRVKLADDAKTMIPVPHGEYGKFIGKITPKEMRRPEKGTPTVETPKPVGGEKISEMSHDEFKKYLYDQAIEIRMEPTAPGHGPKPIHYLRAKIGDEGTFFRKGPLPKGGQSYNYAEGRYESGVSVYPSPEATSFAGLSEGDWFYGRGKIIGIGSDSEPIIKPIGKWEKIGKNEYEAVKKYHKILIKKQSLPNLTTPAGEARMSPSEWSKNPELVADANSTINRLTAEYPDAPKVSIGDLEYAGLQKFTPYTNDAMHQWTVLTKGHPKYESTVAGPTFQLTGEQTKRLRPLGILKGERGSLGKPKTELPEGEKLELIEIDPNFDLASIKVKETTRRPRKQPQVFDFKGDWQNWGEGYHVLSAPGYGPGKKDVRHIIKRYEHGGFYEIIGEDFYGEALGTAKTLGEAKSIAESALKEGEFEHKAILKGERGSLGEPSAPTWYSTLQRTIETKMPNFAPVEQVKALLNQPGVKADEVKWTGLDDFLSEKTGKIGKQEVMDFLKQNEVKVEEVIHEDNLKVHELGTPRNRAPSTKFSQQQLPGGENYRELVLTSNKVTAGPSHAYDNPNHFAWTRFNDRVDSTNKKVLMLEEVQEHDIIKEWRGINKLIKENKATETNILRKVEIEQKMPFVRNWQEVAMRRMVRWAAENEYDKIAWTTGEQQAARYDLSKYINKVRVTNEGIDGYTLSMWDKNDQSLRGYEELRGISRDKLPEYVGKDLSQKIIGDNIAENSAKNYTGLDLKVGGEGMKGFYDKILPEYMNKFGKKWEAKVGETEIPGTQLHEIIKIERGDKVIYEVHNRITGADRTQFDNYRDAINYASREQTGKDRYIVHSLDITPSMKKSVLEEGLPLFQLLPPAIVGAGLLTERLTREKRKSQSSKQNVIRGKK